MKICIIGTGYVGLVTGACFAEVGHIVTCVDTDESKIDRLKIGDVPIYEPGIEDLVKRHQETKQISFTTDLAEGMDDCDVAFIAVGTPSREGDNQADVSRVFEVAQSIAELIAPGEPVPHVQRPSVEVMVRDRMLGGGVDPREGVAGCPTAGLSSIDHGYRGAAFGQGIGDGRTDYTGADHGHVEPLKRGAA